MVVNHLSQDLARLGRERGFSCDHLFDVSHESTSLCSLNRTCPAAKSTASCSTRLAERLNTRVVQQCLARLPWITKIFGANVALHSRSTFPTHPFRHRHVIPISRSFNFDRPQAETSTRCLSQLVKRQSLRAHLPCSCGSSMELTAPGNTMITLACVEEPTATTINSQLS